MAEPQTAPGQALWQAGAKKKRLGRGANIAIAASIAVHGGLFYYIYESKFVVHYKSYRDDAIIAELLPKFVPPPPPKEPPKPQPVNRQPPPAPPQIAPHTPLSPPAFFDGPALPLVVPEPPPPEPPQAAPQEAARPPAPRAIVNPDWSSRPSGEDMARYYPERAQRLGRSGTATLRCQVTAKGTVTACLVASEAPGDWGFGEAALKLSRLFKMKPKMEDGQAVEGATVTIPIAFRID